MDLDRAGPMEDAVCAGIRFGNLFVPAPPPAPNLKQDERLRDGCQLDGDVLRAGPLCKEQQQGVSTSWREV